jgi:hypothetical protein
MSLFIPITKVDAAKQLVYGTLTEEVPDKAGEIIDYESAKPAFREWSQQFHAASGGKSLGNVRAMHGSVAAGKFTDITFNDAQKRIEGVAHIVDHHEWKKVLEGVYTGFSIGGGYARRWPDADNPELMRYTPVLSEVSLVDNPAVPTATFDVIKHDGSIECRKFNFNKEAPVNPDMTAEIDSSDDQRIDALLDDLAWLSHCAQEDGDVQIQQHIAALQEYLGEEGDGDEEDTDYAQEDNDDTSSHAYAGELARLARTESYSANKMEKHLLHIGKQLGALKKRLEYLEAQPVSGKGTLRVVSKSDDRAAAEEVLAKLPQADRVHELMKMALANPQQI